MFFTVKYGAEEEALFNPDCSLRLLVDSIKKRCNFPIVANYRLGLADEKCTIINLSEQNNDLTSCTSLFTERGIYVLVAIVQRESAPTTYKSLLDTVDPEFAQKLEYLSNPRAAEKSSIKKFRSRASTMGTFMAGSSKRRNSSLSKSFNVSSRGK